MESLFSVKQQQRDELSEILGNALGNSRAYAFGSQAGAGLRGLMGAKTFQEEMAMKLDAARSRVTAQPGTEEYFNQFAQQLDALGLKEAAAKASAAGTQAATDKIAKDKAALEFIRADEQNNLLGTRKKVAQQLVKDGISITNNATQFYTEFSDRLSAEGDTAGAMEMAEKAEARAASGKTLAEYVGLTKNQDLTDMFAPQSIANALKLKNDGKGPSEVLQALMVNSDKAGKNAPPSVHDWHKDWYTSAKTRVNALVSADATKYHVLTSKLLAGKMTIPDYMMAFSELRVKNEAAEDLAVTQMKAFNERVTIARSEKAAAQQMLKNLDNAITGTGSDVRLAFQTGIATIADLVGLPVPAAIANATAATGQFKAALGEFVLGSIKKLGANPSNADLEFLQKVLPNAGSTKEAIKLIADHIVKRSNDVILMTAPMKEWFAKGSEQGWKEAGINPMEQASIESAEAEEAIREYIASMNEGTTTQFGSTSFVLPDLKGADRSDIQKQLDAARALRAQQLGEK